jgi:hypothetical protein
LGRYEDDIIAWFVAAGRAVDVMHMMCGLWGMFSRRSFWRSSMCQLPCFLCSVELGLRTSAIQCCAASAVLLLLLNTSLLRRQQHHDVLDPMLHLFLAMHSFCSKQGCWKRSTALVVAYLLAYG